MKPQDTASAEVDKMTQPPAQSKGLHKIFDALIAALVWLLDLFSRVKKEDDMDQADPGSSGKIPQVEVYPTKSCPRCARLYDCERLKDACGAFIARNEPAKK